MAQIKTSLPGCCSVGIMYSFYGHDIADFNGLEGVPTSKHFLVILRRNQQWVFDKLCAKYTCVSAVPIPGAYEGNKKYLAVCIFKVGKEK